jgi:hypothetical protein
MKLLQFYTRRPLHTLLVAFVGDLSLVFGRFVITVETITLPRYGNPANRVEYFLS